jgi:hypothetical protein
MPRLWLAGTFMLANGALWAGSGTQDSIERLSMSSDVLHSTDLDQRQAIERRM